MQLAFWVIGVLNLSNGLWMLFAPEHWYHHLPAGVPDTGAFNVYTGVDPKKAPEAVKVVISELERLRDRGPATSELTKARELSKGRMLMRMEDSRAVSGWIGVQELLLGKVRAVEDIVDEMDAVTIEDLQRVVKRIAFRVIIAPLPDRFERSEQHAKDWVRVVDPRRSEQPQSRGGPYVQEGHGAAVAVPANASAGEGVPLHGCLS